MLLVAQTEIVGRENVAIGREKEKEKEEEEVM